VTKVRFTAILRALDYPQEAIDDLWASAGPHKAELDEDAFCETAQRMRSMFIAVYGLPTRLQAHLN